MGHAYGGAIILIAEDFSSHESQKETEQSASNVERKELSTLKSLSVKISFRNEEHIKTISEKIKQNFG